MKKVTLTALTITVALGGLGVSSAVMASQRGQNMPSFENFDTNGDGVITQAEVEAHGAAKFAESDANGDGYLDAEELQAQLEARRSERRGPMGDKGPMGNKGPMGGHTDADQDNSGFVEMMQRQFNERMEYAAAQMLQRMDTDGDGKVSAEEAQAPAAGRMFERVDADGNGEVTQEEWDALKNRRGRHNN